MTTLDFHIKPAGKSAFGLEVFQRGRSQPLAASSFEYDLSYLTQFEINQLEPSEKDPQGRMERITVFGKKLYDRVFTPAIKDLWDKAKHESDFLVLCIRIDPVAKDLETLPWETLHDGHEFLAAGAKTAVSRLPLDVEIQESLPAVPTPLKMLALMSSPLDLQENERLQIEREQEILLQAVNAPSGQGKLLLELEDEAKLAVLESSLEGGCHILHYSGHGIAPESGGGLLLEDGQGKRRPTAVAEIMQSLEKAEHALRLVVISGCQTCKTLSARGFHDLARGLLRRGIPATIAMQFSISDAAGLIFAQELYPRLVEGQRLDAAVSAARRTLLHQDDVRIKADAFAPVLLAANSLPLETTQPETPGVVGQPRIDFSFHLPLPQLAYGFYGRRKEYRAIRDGIIAKNHRAVVVHGIGGIGKTALISHVATRLREHFRGVYAFDCTSAALAPATILLELHRYLERQGVKVLHQLIGQSIPPDQLATILGQVLSQRPILLIFDNFETHLTAQDGQRHGITDPNLDTFIKTLVKTTATGTRFLFTTRYLFDLDAKRIGDIQQVPLDDLSRPEALGLMQRLPCLAGASYEDKLTAFDTFGGHPYALVTLDRHCAHRPLADVLKDAKSVHAELREFLAIELNYSRLSDRARVLLTRLAAFRKPVPLAAAEWTLGERMDEETVARQVFARRDLNREMKKLGEAEFVKQHRANMPEMRKAEDVAAPIGELVAWGLLTPQEQDGQPSGVAVHSLVRDFCRDKLGEKAWRPCLCDAAAFYTNQTKLLSDDEKSPEAVWTEIEAFELLVEAGQYKQAASVLIVAQALLTRWGFGRLLESLYGRVLKNLSGEFEAVCRGNVAILLQLRCEYEAAIAQHQRVGEAFRSLGDMRNVAASLHEIGTIHQRRGDYEQALRFYEQSREIIEELGDRAGVSTSLHQIGTIHQAWGDYEQALRFYEQSRKIAEELGDRAGLATSLHQIGMIHQLRSEYNQALCCYEQYRKILERLGDRAGYAKSLHQIGMIHQLRGDYEQALRFYEQSRKIAEELGDRAGIASSHGQMGKLYADTKRYRDAFEHFLTALAIFTEIGAPEGSKAARDLRNVRGLWGAADFDKAWRERTGHEVAEWFMKDIDETGDQSQDETEERADG
ncbi:MAG: tetratricopeptide repeat protein [Phycisphaerae bacterium]|nr:tetratricopeptide repeat protein [Phycisphaerae bacterium]